MPHWEQVTTARETLTFSSIYYFAIWMTITNRFDPSQREPLFNKNENGS